MNTVLIIALIVQAIWYTMQDGEIFGKLGNWLHANLPKKLHSPVFDCPVCMTPWYGTILYWSWPGSPYVWGWLVTVLAAMGLQVVIGKLSPPKDADND